MTRRIETTRPADADRRRFLAALAAAPLVVGTATRGEAMAPPPPLETDPFEYEIQRSDAEWRALLSDAEYEVLREGWTELPFSSDKWKETREGLYGCRGCGLHVYSSTWRVPMDKGWVFFVHSERAAVLTGIDGPQESYGMDPNGPGTMIEVHCRRCASHLGHILIVDGRLLHCINSTSVTFNPTEA